jgi:pimeloyl-ACP methyl ester carboxylesterase
MVVRLATRAWGGGRPSADDGTGAYAPKPSGDLPSAGERSDAGEFLGVGDGAAAPLALLIHGVTSSSRTWWRVAPVLVRRGYRVLAVDLRGHGESPPVGEGLALDDLTDDVLTTLRLDIARPGRNAGRPGPSAEHPGWNGQRTAEPGERPAGAGQPAGGAGEWAGGSGEWAGGSGEWAGGSGEWAGGSGEWAGGSGEWAGGSGKRAGGTGAGSGTGHGPAGADGGAAIDLVMGHSLGALVALDLVARAPGVARRLVLEDPPGPTGVDWTAMAEGIEADGRRARAEPEAMRRELAAPNSAWDPREIDRRVADLAACDADGIAAALRRTTAFDVTGLADAVRIPTLLVVGLESLGSALVGPDRGALVHALGDRVELQEFDAGHNLHREAFAPFMEVVDRWLVATADRVGLRGHYD